MEKKATDLQFQMGISSLNVLRFSQYDVAEFNVSKKDAIEYQSEFGITILEELEEIAIETTVRLKIQELNEYFGELKTVMKFSIIPFDIVVKKEGESYKLPDAVMLNLFNIVVGTIRGILYEKLRGTILQNETLPLMNPKSIILPKVTNKES